MAPTTSQHPMWIPFGGCAIVFCDLQYNLRVCRASHPANACSWRRSSLHETLMRGINLVHFHLHKYVFVDPNTHDADWGNTGADCPGRTCFPSGGIQTLFSTRIPWPWSEPGLALMVGGASRRLNQIAALDIRTWDCELLNKDQLLLKLLNILLNPFVNSTPGLEL